MHGQSVEMLRKSKISDVEQRWHRRAVKAASVEFNSAGQFLSRTYRQPRSFYSLTVGEGCPSEAQEDVDWLTATDALVSRAPVGHVDRPGGVWPIRDKEVDRQGYRAPEYFQKRIYRSVVMTCRRFQHATLKRRASTMETINYDQVVNAMEALKKFLNETNAKQSNSKDEFFLDSNRDAKFVQVMITLKKVPKNFVGSVVQLRLPHPFVDPSSVSICLIVRDLSDNRRNYEYDKWSRHFKEMLQEKGVTDVDYVISFSHLIREYNTYEQKKKLAKSYDKFLMDNRLNQTSVNKHLGKVFKDLKKLPIMVDITKVKFSNKYQCKIGLTSQCCDELVGNFRAIMEKWQISFPGALSNVRTMYLVVDHLPPLPVYASFASANLVQFPKRPRRIPPPVVGELSTVVSDVQVRSHADGRVEFVDKKGKLKTTKNNSSTRLWYEELKKKKRSKRVGRQFRKYRKTKRDHSKS
ncbi:Ribosomal L1 domain-containing protein [Trichinella spiralis]|uniref:Ribosomal L1 domain-containing protein n=1 Tax=Trichinella spiralis TaxID=6334 RepID=A0ABR3KEX2_TRISP